MFITFNAWQKKHAWFHVRSCPLQIPKFFESARMSNSSHVLQSVSAPNNPRFGFVASPPTTTPNGYGMWLVVSQFHISNFPTPTCADPQLTLTALTSLGWVAQPPTRIGISGCRDSKAQRLPGATPLLAAALGSAAVLRRNVSLLEAGHRSRRTSDFGSLVNDGEYYWG